MISTRHIKTDWKKNCLFFISCFFLIAPLTAQTEKGNYLVGGSADASLSFYYTTRNFNASLQPSFGVFVVKNLAIGVNYSFGISGSHIVNATTLVAKETNSFATSLGPYIKYYLGKKGLRGVFAANGGIALSTGVRTETNHSPSQAFAGFSAGAMVGLAYFFNEHISLEPGLYINASGYQTQLPTTRVGFSLGLYAFLNKKKPAPAVKPVE